jgi:diguanylate cyclase (GGDEF)-like protein/PAS domain S-box-containing protein
MKPTRILLVEDESVIAFDLEMQLTNLNYEVVAIVASGELAIDRAGELNPEIVLMDINLAGDMDGIEAARTVREHFKIPVVFLTAYAEDDILQRAEASRPYGYLVKPCEGRELHATLQMALVRRMAEAQVEASEERLRLALDAAGLGIWEFDVGSRRVITGGHFYCVMETPEQIGEPPLETLLKVVQASDRPDVEAALTEALSQEKQLHRVFRHDHDDGRVAWVEMHAKSYPGTRGKITRIIGVVRDITEQHESEDRLRAAAAVFDTTTEGIFIADDSLRIITVNPAFLLITGFEKQEAIGAEVNQLLLEAPLLPNFFGRIGSIPGGYWQGELRCRHADGHGFPAWASISVVRDMTGAVQRYVGALSDMSLLRHAENNLTQLAFYDSLTKLPSRHLFNDRLEQALAGTDGEPIAGGLLLIDLDRFKELNARLGRARCDALLQDIAKRIGSVLQKADTVARFDGDEFFVLLPRIRHSDDAERIAANLLAAIACPSEESNPETAVSASIGIALYPKDGADPQALMQAADRALCRAKEQGRNRYCL